MGAENRQGEIFCTSSSQGCIPMLRNKMPESLFSTSLPSYPLITGLRACTDRLSDRNWWQRAAVTNVFPIPVPVPVTKKVLMRLSFQDFLLYELAES